LAGKGPVWIERVRDADGFDVWFATEAGPDQVSRPEVAAWTQSAAAIFRDRPEVASISLISGARTGAAVAAASIAALPHCFFSSGVADLIGIAAEDHQQHVPAARFKQWVERATLKGLVHLWLTHAEGAPAPVAERAVLVPWHPLSRDADPPPISLAIDAAWLLGGESGAQAFVFEMVAELLRRPAIARVVFVSDSGGVPRRFAGAPKVSGVSWAAVEAGSFERCDILHRPYQPGADVDYRRYLIAARCVAITVLDFIAYDNPSYHESRADWREYQRAFDEKVCAADSVLAISRYIGDRLERQFPHQLSAPVRSIHLGTNHLAVPPGGAPATSPWPADALSSKSFLLVLGNDFEHKNRDFAVKVFGDMCARGYGGKLVLAGFHLDSGSSYGHELEGAGAYADRILRIGSVTTEQKTWLLRHAQCVLYPTSCEGFGLIPFEAATLGSPTAFVKFGPLRETMPGVRACAGWQVRGFADHVFGLIADPAAPIAEVVAAGAALTWERCVDQIVDQYRVMLSAATPWRSERPAPETAGARAGRAAAALAARAIRKLQRLTGRG
jgi:glycosyltransferase involved in cell wall biosynthesis